SMEDEEDGILAEEQKQVRNAKKVVLMVAGAATQKYMQNISEQQELLMGIADIIMEVYAMESTLLRTQKFIQANSEQKADLRIEATRAFISDAMDRIEVTARPLLAALVEGDMLRTQLAALKRFTRHTPYNSIQARQRIAAAMSETGKYIF
ncbi:MAG: acyl-CoA dehydrogenase, partial [bacterium]